MKNDNIIISGLVEKDNESAEDIVLEMAKEMNVNINKHDIIFTQRIRRKRPNKPRHIVVKLARRQVKRSIIKSRKQLKDNNKFKSVYVNEDVTFLRRSILYHVKQSGNGNVWFQNGKVFCATGNKEAGGKLHVLESPDDLFKLGWTEEQVNNCKFYSKTKEVME